jgi:allantoate deiminase
MAMSRAVWDDLPRATKQDLKRSAERIGNTVHSLAGPNFTRGSAGVERYAYTPEYARTVAYVQRAFDAIGFRTWEDAVGNFVAQNAPRGTPVVGLGSHLDSVRGGGRWDGTLGVVVALEVCHLLTQYDLDVPVRVISFVEEEGSGFGQLLLGSRIAAGLIDEDDLRSTYRAVDDGRSFWDHAVLAGHQPHRWRECAETLDDLFGWIEIHIEQGRQLEDAGHQIGIVELISGYVQGDIELTGRVDHAGTTPMRLRSDAVAMAAEVVIEAEKLAATAGPDTVATVGEIDVTPGIINVVPGEARLSIDVRGPKDSTVQEVVDGILIAAEQAAARRSGRMSYVERQRVGVTPMSSVVVDALTDSANGYGFEHLKLPSGAAHDTMSVARRAPCGMLFIPCVAGISHAPNEEADPRDAALAAWITLDAIVRLHARSRT